MGGGGELRQRVSQLVQCASVGCQIVLSCQRQQTASVPQLRWETSTHECQQKTWLARHWLASAVCRKRRPPPHPDGSEEEEALEEEEEKEEEE